jgi:SAM-dependent methyltransferase
MAERDEIAKRERAIYQRMWGEDSYRERSPGMRFLDQALATAQPERNERIIDLGCGTGRVCAELQNRGFVSVTGLDIASNACKEFKGRVINTCLWQWESAEWFDVAFCFDVMEHIPTEQVEDTLDCIAGHCDRVYFQIANFVCHEGDKFGYHLHPTVKPLTWWLDAMRKVGFQILHAEQATKHHLIMVT